MYIYHLCWWFLLIKFCCRWQGMYKTRGGRRRMQDTRNPRNNPNTSTSNMGWHKIIVSWFIFSTSNVLSNQEGKVFKIWQLRHMHPLHLHFVFQIRDGCMYDKNEVLDNLKEYVEEPFVPILVRDIFWFSKGWSSSGFIVKM